MNSYASWVRLLRAMMGLESHCILQHAGLEGTRVAMALRLAAPGDVAEASHSLQEKSGCINDCSRDILSHRR